MSAITGWREEGFLQHEVPLAPSPHLPWSLSVHLHHPCQILPRWVRGGGFTVSERPPCEIPFPPAESSGEGSLGDQNHPSWPKRLHCCLFPLLQISPETCSNGCAHPWQIHQRSPLAPDIHGGWSHCSSDELCPCAIQRLHSSVKGHLRACWSWTDPRRQSQVQGREMSNQCVHTDHQSEPAGVSGCCALAEWSFAGKCPSWSFWASGLVSVISLACRMDASPRPPTKCGSYGC